MTAKPLSKELISEIHTLIVNNPATVQTGSKILDAVESMLDDPRTHAVYVVDEDEKVIGIITLSDLIGVTSVQTGAVAKKKMFSFWNYSKLLYCETVDDIMRKPVTMRLDDTIISALRVIEEHNLFALPLVDDKGRLIGELNGLEILMEIHEKITSGEARKIFY